MDLVLERAEKPRAVLFGEARVQSLSAGGLAQMMMAAAERELDDCVAWFGYCGDAKALAVDLRAGYVETNRRHVIVKWFDAPPPAGQQRLIDEIAKIGPF